MTPMKSSVEELKRRVVASAKLPLEHAMSLPPEVYTSEAYFDYEVATVLSRSWMGVAHVSQLKKPGDYVNIELLGEPLLVIRAKDGQIRVLSRVCPHRAMDVMSPASAEAASETGNAPILVCPYHRWSFDLDGKLKGCPEMHEAADFNKEDWGLSEFRSEIWQGFVFVDFSGEAEPLETQFAGWAEIIAPWKVAEMQMTTEMEWIVDANWKVMVENWAESYHHLGSHHSSLHVQMPAGMTWCEQPDDNVLRCHLPYKPELVAELKAATAAGNPPPGFRPIQGLTEAQENEWGVWVGLPCFMFLTGPDRTIWYRLQPLSAGKCKLTTTTLVDPANFADPDYEKTLKEQNAMLADFHMEDMAMYPGVQRGLNSRAARPGRLSHLEDPVLRLQRYLARRIEEDGRRNSKSVSRVSESEAVL